MAVNQSTLSSTGTEGTISGAGARYVSIVTWESIAQDQHNAGDQTILECYKGTTVTGNWQVDGSLDELRLDIKDWSNVTETDNVTIRAATGNECNGVSGSGFSLKSSITGFTYCVDVSAFYVSFYDIEFHQTQTDNRRRPINCNGTVISTYRCLILQDSINSSASGLYGSAGAFITQNCVITAGVFLANGVDASVYNCTIIGKEASGSAFRTGTANEVDIRNTVAYSPLLSFDGSSANYLASSTNNASSDATQPGANGVPDITTADFVDYPTDLNPAPSGKLEDTGANLDTIFTDDITRYTRPASPAAWEIGAYEIQGAAPGVTFDGPDIVAQTGTENVLFSFDENGEGNVASRFTGATSYAYAPGSDTPAGITVNATTGNLEGTPTVNGTFNITIEGSD